MAPLAFELPLLREGVVALRAQAGLLFQDALRWRLFFIPATAGQEGVLRFLELQGLSARSPVPAASSRLHQVFMVPAAQAPAGEIRLPAGARFSCACCGRSCRSILLGPLFPPDVERLLAIDWTGTGYHPGQFFTDDEGNPAGEERVAERRDLFLRRIGKACQFLRPDNLCDLHARFGAEAKPLMCRTFPLEFRASPSGVVAGVRLAECLEAVKVSAGELIGQDEARRLYSELATVPVLPGLVWLSEGALVTWAEYEELEARVLAGVPGEPLPGDAHGGGLALLLRALHALEGRAVRPPPPPAAAATLALLSDWSAAAEVQRSGLPLLRRPSAQGFEEEALQLEERFCRLALFGKVALQNSDVASGVAMLAVQCWLARGQALALAGAEGLPRATAANVNGAWKVVQQLSLRDRLADDRLPSRAVASAIAAALPPRRP